MRETWYVLEDGSSADPREVAPDQKGVLRHSSGVAVAIGAHGNHRSRGVDIEVEIAKRKKLATKETPPPRNREVKADDPDRKYKTR